MKAILIIDMPKDCERCDCSFDDTDYGLFCSPLKRDIFGRDEKPSWCPLKPMPKKKNKKDIVIKGKTAEILEARFEGWNDCIKEILDE